MQLIKLGFYLVKKSQINNEKNKKQVVFNLLCKEIL